jgi:hypothetical protein
MIFALLLFLVGMASSFKQLVLPAIAMTIFSDYIRGLASRLVGGGFTKVLLLVCSFNVVQGRDILLKTHADGWTVHMCDFPYGCTWRDARNKCQLMGRDLVTISDADMVDEIQEALLPYDEKM